jgi:hypothetical protein
VKERSEDPLLIKVTHLTPYLFLTRVFVDIWQFAEGLSKKERGVVSSVAWGLYALSIMLGGAKFWRMPSLGIERSLRFAFVLREMILCSSAWLCNKMYRWRAHPSRRCKTDE